MKKLLYLIFLLPTFLFAQPRYGVEGIPMCWKIGSIDSNITRYVIISSTGSPVQTIAWENANGQVINVSGGYLRYGYCDCAGGGGSGGNGIYGGSGTLPNALVQVQNTQGIKFVEPGTQNGILIANKANGAAAVALDPTYTDSIRQGLIWKQGTDSAAVGIDKDGRLQLLSNNWVAIGNDQAKIIIRKDDAVVLIKTGNNVYALADGVPLSGKNNVMLWPNGSASGRFANLDSLVDGRAKRDTFITVPPSTNYFQNIIDNPARFYNNIYLSCKGRTDTSIVAFLAAPVFEEQKGVVYHIKNDSGLVAAFVINYHHLSNNKLFYLLQRGQTAQVRLLPDAANGGDYRWAVSVVWDSIGGGSAGNGIYSGSDSLSQTITHAKMVSSQSFGIGKFADVRYPNYSTDFGLNISLDENGYIGLHHGYSYIEARHDLASLFGRDGNYFGNQGVRGISSGIARTYSEAGTRTFKTYARNGNEIRTAVGGGQFPYASSSNSAVYETPSGNDGTQAVSLNITTPSKKSALVNYSGIGDTLYYNYMGNGDSLELNFGGSILSGRLAGFNPLGAKFYKIGSYRRSTDAHLAELFKVDFLAANGVRFYGKYDLPNTTPSNTANDVGVLNWIGTGSTSTPRISKINDVVTGTSRIIPYMNSSGRFVTGNTYFKLDTTTTSGAQARVRLLINNPNGDAGEGDSYSVLSVRAGDALGSEAITNFGDQALTQGTTGYGAVIQLSRSGGNFTTKTNLSSGNEVGKFAWRGYVNGGSRALGHVLLNYKGDGTTISSELIGASAVSGSVVSGWKLDNTSKFWLGLGADDYYFPTTAPTTEASRRKAMYWDGTGSGSTPAWKDAIVYGDGPFTIPVSGEYTVTLPFTMSSDFYNVLITLKDNNGVGTNVTYQLIDQTTTTFKLKFFVANTGAVPAPGNYSLYYKLEEF